MDAGDTEVGPLTRRLVLPDLRGRLNIMWQTKMERPR